ncbi:MAG: adenosylcobinamide-GDP ribazoletransferase [Rhodospirillales bacterium]|nr:adenosylcobinamide-GDP ribazoletransferase [Rhodospirillales bacterium]
MTLESKHHSETPNEAPATGFNPWRDVVLVITFLTRLPLPLSGHAARPLASAAWAFPFAGVLTGGVGGGIFLGAVFLGLPLVISLILGLMASVLLSGGLHEDGLADVADGFGGGSTRDQKLEIMHDSRIGAYGVLALIFIVSLRITALFAIGAQSSTQIVFVVFLTSAIFSRGILPAVMAALPPTRVGGLSKEAGRPGVGGVIVAFLLGVAGALVPFCSDYQPVTIAMLSAVGAVIILGLIARRQIGGQTGDVIGAAQQIGETAFLVALSVAIGGNL